MIFLTIRLDQTCLRADYRGKLSFSLHHIKDIYKRHEVSMNYHCGYNIGHLIELVTVSFTHWKIALPHSCFSTCFQCIIWKKVTTCSPHLRNGDLYFKSGACIQTIWNSARETCILCHLFINSIVYIGVNSQAHNLYLTYNAVLPYLFCYSNFFQLWPLGNLSISSLYPFGILPSLQFLLFCFVLFF